ncbi:MAG: TonB-dependent receptor [Rhizobiales bacterium]|nr:TonB-dependent receptor [Hyphomicrobiales bacterium]
MIILSKKAGTKIVMSKTNLFKTLTSVLVLSTAISTSPIIINVANSADYGEMRNQARQYNGDLGYSISIDGELVDGGQSAIAERQSLNVPNNNMDIQVKFDGLGVKPILNVSTFETRRSFSAGERIGFQVSSNYPSWISAAEVRIYERGHVYADQPIAILPVNRAGQAAWAMPQFSGPEFVYKVRVYDSESRFDETALLSIARTSGFFQPHKISSKIVSAGNGEDNTAIRNIPVYGGAVTIYGSAIPHGHSVKAFGEVLPLDDEGNFVIQRILPPGDHNVHVNVDNHQGSGVVFDRKVHIPQNEWFYVGLADLTIGKNFDHGKVQNANNEYDKFYKKGRLAFYLKGKIKGRYLLTAAADTREGDLHDLFKDMNSKDPRQLLRRIDPDEYYPVYGDDSDFVDDAPTNGKFYVRLERGDSHVMWGNFKSKVSGSKFIRSERNLYGAQSVYRSQNATTRGERHIEVELHAAQPDTLPHRDSLRGTGGSAYFLTRQDISKGTESVNVEIRDLVTGQVIGRQKLIAGTDYTIDYIQGVIILKKPLASTSSDGDLIRSSALGDYGSYLTVQYEYTPALQDVDGYSFGTRAQAWLTDKLRVGVSGMNDKGASTNRKSMGIDFHLRAGQNSHLNVEVAKSKGGNFSRSTSLNGGLTISNSGSSGSNGHGKKAYSIEGKIDLSDMHPSLRGHVGMNYQRREKGFTSLDYDTNSAQEILGFDGEIELSKNTKLKTSYEDYSNNAGKSRREINVEGQTKIGHHWVLGAGVQHTGRKDTQIASNNGHRTDLGAKLTYKVNEDNSVYIFGQKTVHKDGNRNRNDRLGLGAEAKLTEKIGVKGEISRGTSGVGGLAAVTYDPTADDHYYAGYTIGSTSMEASGSSLHGSDLDGLVFGRKRKYSDQLSAYSENKYDMFGSRQSLTTTYGVTYTPSALWTINGGFEYGEVNEKNGEKLDRKAVSLAVAFVEKDMFSWRLKGEVRLEDSHITSKSRDTYLVSAGLTDKINDNWRIQGSLDALISQSDQSDILNGDYVEGSFGFAYRPIEDDSFNGLLKYAFLYDLPGADQIAANGSTLGPAQRSHVFTADGIIDINQYFSFGAKAAYRKGQVSTTRSANDFVDSSAYLGIARLDVHIVKKWDALLEARVLASPMANTTNYGFLAGVSRHINDHIKVGAGYNFGRFSEDITDLTHDDKGAYINVVGKL